MRPGRSEIIRITQGFVHEIAELGLDSLSTLEMVGMLERELSIHMPTDELTDIHTVGQLADMIEQKLTAAGR